MNIEIKEATWQDWKIFDRIQMHDGFKHTHYVYRERVMADAKRKGLKFLVAYLEEKPVGFAAFYFGVFPTLQFLSVREEYQNKKIEQMLIRKIVSRVKEKDLAKIRVFAEVGTGIEKLYESVGFKKAGYCPSRFGRTRDAFIMLLKF